MALTPAEDHELRRIHGLGKFGELPDTMQARFRELRERDQRRGVREPELDVQWPVHPSAARRLEEPAETHLAG
jgi:hypothetical protein